MSFQNAGGMFFFLGSSGRYLAYDKGGVIDPKGDFGHSIWIVNFLTVWESVLDKLQVTKAYIGGYSYGAYSAVWKKRIRISVIYYQSKITSK